MVEKVNAYSYLRISTDAQKVGDGVRRQIEAGEKYAAEHGYELVETISDLGVSGYKGKNAQEGAFRRFLDAIEDGTVPSGSVLIVESLDRLSRAKVLQAFTQFADILNKGITIVTLVDDQVYTAESVVQNPGQLFMSLGIMLRANDESATKASRMRAVWQKKRQNLHTEKLTRRVPAWLELNDGKTDFIVREEAAQVVREIFDMSAKGMGVYTIARHMNSNLEHYPPIADAKRWNNSYISKILHNKAVFGCFQPSLKEDGKRTPIGELIKNYYPPIVSEEKFYLVQNRLKERRVGGAGRKGNSFSNLFTGLAFCVKCGGKLNYRSKGKSPKGGQYLRCGNSILNNGCRCPAWRYSEFEESFLRFVQEISFAEIFNTSGVGERQANLQQQKDSMDSILEEKMSAYQTLLQRFENPELPDFLLSDLVRRSEQLQSELSECKLKISELEEELQKLSGEDSESDRSDFISRYKVLLDGSPEEIREARYFMHGILRKNIEKIEVFNGERVNPWESLDFLPEWAGRFLLEKGIEGAQAYEDFFAKPSGQRFFDKISRYYIVHFKNGVTRRVAADYTILDTSPADLELINGFKS